MAADEIPDWLQQLFSTSLLLDQVEPAHEWAKTTGCILMDLLDDDALDDLVMHLGLRKYEAKRLRKALKVIAPDVLASRGTSPTPPAGAKKKGDSVSWSPCSYDDEGGFPSASPEEPERESASGSAGPKRESASGSRGEGVSMSMNAAEPEGIPEPEPERLFQQSPHPWMSQNSPHASSETPFLLSPVTVLDQEVPSLCSFLEGVVTPAASPLTSPADEVSRAVSSQRRGSCPASSLRVVVKEQRRGSCPPVPEGWDCPSPRKVLARQMLEQLEESPETSSDDQALGSIEKSFSNPDDVFAAFEAFGPGAVAMFEFDAASQKFGLTADAENIFNELGISNGQSSGKNGVSHFMDALESGTIKKQELQQFLGRFLGDDRPQSRSSAMDEDEEEQQCSPSPMPDRTMFEEISAESIEALLGRPDLGPDCAASHNLADASPEASPCNEEGQLELQMSSPQPCNEEEEALPQESSLQPCNGEEEAQQAADEDAESSASSEFYVPDQEDLSAEGAEGQVQGAEGSSFAPMTSIEAQILLANAAAQAVVLQKRVVDQGPNQRAVIALELWEKNSDENLLLAQLDALRVLEILPVKPYTSSADWQESSLTAENLAETSFVLTAQADAVLYLRAGKTVHDVFHSIAESNQLSLHVSVGTCITMQAEATRFFNGLRLLARLPADDWLRLAAEQASVDVTHTEAKADAEEKRDAKKALQVREQQFQTAPPADRRQSFKSGSALKIDLSHIFGGGADVELPSTSSSLPLAQTIAPGNSPRTGEKGEKEIRFNACHVRWNVVAEAARERGWTIVTSEEKAPHCNVHWMDEPATNLVLPYVQPWMRANHFPGTCRVLGRKCRLARTMARMQKLLPEEYNFTPRTWILPNDFSELVARAAKDEDVRPTYIVKPDGMSQGRGIFLTDDLDRLSKCTEECRGTGKEFVVQKYLGKPMLLDGLKFDMRIYLLVVGGNAGVGSDLRLFLFRDGLVRLCTEKYQAPTNETFDQPHMHITNYEQNRGSDSFSEPNLEELGNSSKRSMIWFMDYIESQYGQEERQRVWSDVISICVKTVLAAQPTFEAEYDACFTKDLTSGSMGCRSFEILGFDVMLTEKRKAYLLEVNHLPSFGCHSSLDHDIKRRLIDQTFDLTCEGIEAGTNKASYQDMVSKGIYEDLESKGQSSAPAGNGLLDLASYKDFDRILPPTENSPDGLADIATSISDKVKGVFSSIISKGPKASSPCPATLAERRSITPPRPITPPEPRRSASVEPTNRAKASSARATTETSSEAGSSSSVGPAKSAGARRQSVRIDPATPVSAKSTQRRHSDLGLSRSSSVPGLVSSAAPRPSVASTKHTAIVGAYQKTRRPSAWSVASDRGLNLAKSDSAKPSTARASVTRRLSIDVCRSGNF